MQEASDFSFFGEDDGGCLFLREDRCAITVDGGLIWESGREAHTLIVVGELSAWGGGREEAFECGGRIGRGVVDIALLGHWGGRLRL